MSLAAADKLLKIFDALKNFREGIPVVDPNPLAKKKESLLSKKERISYLNTIPELVCSSGIRSLSEFPKILAITVDSLLVSCDDQESDVRLVAGESLNKLIKGLMDSFMGRIHVELYKKIKENGSARSLRAALSRFGDLCHLIRPQKCRPFIANLLPCIARVSIRTEETIQEILAIVMQKIMSVLGSFTGDKEVKQLLKTFLPNLQSSSATTRRTAASGLVVICQYSRKPSFFYEWLLNILLGLVLPFHEDKDSTVYLGVLMCLRHMIPNLDCSFSFDHQMKGLRGSFGSHCSYSADGTLGAEQIQNNQLLQVYEVIMYCTKHSNHNVVTASLETLLQLLRAPPPALLSILLSAEGITPSAKSDASKQDLEFLEETPSEGDPTMSELETASIAESTASTVDTGVGSSIATDFDTEQTSVDEMLRSAELDRLRLHSGSAGDNDQTREEVEEGIDVFDSTMSEVKTENRRTTRSLSDPGYAAETDNNASIDATQNETQVSHGTFDYVAHRDSDGLELTTSEDDTIRTESVSTQEVRLLVERSFQIDAVACKGVPLVHCVRLMSSFLLSGNPGEMLSDSCVRVSVKSLALSCIAQAVKLYPEAFLVRILPELSEDSDGEEFHQSSPQLVRDILLFSGHGDPQLRGSLATVIGNVVRTGLKKGRLDFDTWCIDNCQEMETVPFGLEDLISVLKSILQDESPVAIRQACVSLKSCLFLLCSSKHSKVALDLLNTISTLKDNSYWLVKVELLEILGEVDFRLLGLLKLKFEHLQESGMHKLFKTNLQEDLINNVILHLLEDEDIRVRQAAAKCVVSIVPRLFHSLNSDKQALVVSAAQSQISSLFIQESHCKAFTHSVVDANLSRIVTLVGNKLNHSTSRTCLLGCIHVLSLLVETFPVASYPEAYGCSVSISCRSPLPAHPIGPFSAPSRPSSPSASCAGGGGPLSIVMGSMMSSWLAYDLFAHQQLLQIAGNILFGAGCSGVHVTLKVHSERGPSDEPISSAEHWSVFTDSTLAPQAEKLVLHMARLLNIFTHVVEHTTPGAHSFKIPFPGQNKDRQQSSAIPGVAAPHTPPSASAVSSSASTVPKKLLTKTKRALSEADLHQASSDKPLSPSKTQGGVGQSGESEQSTQNPPPKSSIGTFHHIPHYMKLYEIIKGAYANNQVSLLAPDQDKFCQFLSATLHSLSLLLEVSAFADIGKHVEEILGYLQVCVKLEATKTLLCVQQLLRAMFGINALSQPELIQNLTVPPCLATSLVTVPRQAEMLPVDKSFYHFCFVYPLVLVTHSLQKLKHKEEIKEKGKESEELGGIGVFIRKLRNKAASSIRPPVKLDKQSPIHSYIRWFEPLVIRALKEYTMSSKVILQQQVLSLLAQLIKLRVNYSLLDADQVFISFVQKQFEYIDAGQINYKNLVLDQGNNCVISLRILITCLLGSVWISQEEVTCETLPGVKRSCDTFLPHIFQFLVLLSYECFQPKFNQAKAIVGMPRIIQLCDGIMAGGQPAQTHAIPALQPIIHDLFVLRTASGSEIGGDLETQREVVVSMLLRLVHYPEVLEMLVTVLNCYQRDEVKWKDLSGQIIDLLLPLLANQKVHVESEYGIEMLQAVFTAVAPGSLWPVDVLLRVLFSSFDQSDAFKRWLATILVVLQTLMAQVTEDILLSRIDQSGFRPRCVNMMDKPLLPIEVFVKFLFYVVETSANHVNMATRNSLVNLRSPSEEAFLLKLFGSLLSCVTHLLKSANFKKVSQLASSSPIIHPTVDLVNENLSHLVDTHPVLVLQWCHVLRQLKYTDTQFWFGFLDTGLRLSTASGSNIELEGPTLNKDVTRSGVILIYCDLLITQHMEQGSLDQSQVGTLLRMSLEDLVQMTDEPPIQGFLSILYSTHEGSKLLLDSFNSSRALHETVKRPSLVRDLMNCLKGVHQSQSVYLIKILAEYFLNSTHQSVARMAERLICKKLEICIDGQKMAPSQELVEDELRSVCQLIASKKEITRNQTLLSLVTKILPSSSPVERDMPCNEDLASSMKNYTIDQEWFCRLAQQCCFAARPMDQRNGANVKPEAIQMLSVLNAKEVSFVINHENFDISLLEECISLGIERTLLLTSRRQNGENVPSNLLNNAEHFENHDVDQLLLISKLALFSKIEQVAKDVITTRTFRDNETSTKLQCFQLASDRLSALCNDADWCKKVTSLARALVALAGAIPTLPKHCKIPESGQEALFQFVFVPLAMVHYSLVNGKRPCSVELKSNLECLAKYLNLDCAKSIGKLEFFPLVCSAINHVHVLLNAVDGSGDNDEEGFFTDQIKVDMGDEGVQIARKACGEISQLIHRLLTILKPGSVQKPSLPQFLLRPFQDIIVGLARRPLVNSYARTLPLVWKMGWTPVPEGPLKTELPPLPIEILKEKDVLDEFVKRVNLIGWTSRQQFEETWAALLGVISSPPLPDTVSTEEDMESTHSCCLAVRCISELLLQTTLYPVPGNPSASAYLHRPRHRDLPFLGSRAGKKLTFVRGMIEEEFVSLCCTGTGRVFISDEDLKPERSVSVHRSNSFLCLNSSSAMWITNRMLFDHPLYGLNVDRVLGFHDYTLGQISVGALHSQAQSELQERYDSEDDTAVVVSLPRMPQPEKLDIKSCEQFLLELFEQWMSPYIHPRTPLALLSEATKALLVLSDLFVDGTHFEWVLGTLLDLHHNHSAEDDLLIQYLLPTLCKALAFLKTEGSITERVGKIVESSLRSPHVPLQISALYGAMYLLEIQVPSVSAVLLPILTDFLGKKLTVINGAVSMAEHHLLVMWSTAFYLLERYADEISDQELKANLLKNAVRTASSNEDSTPTCVYHAIIRGLERLVVSFALSSAESDSLVKLSVDRLSMQNPQRAISALGLLVTCMYTGKIGDRPSGIYPPADTAEFPTEDILLIAMERVTVLFDRIRKGVPSEAKVVARVLPPLLLDFFPAQEIMNKVIGEFLSSQQPHPELMAQVLFKVFEGLHSQGQQTEVRDWVLLSLGSFIQRTPLSMAVWSLTCFFISASSNKWIRALFSYIVGRMGKLEDIDVRIFCAAAMDFYRTQNLDANHKETLISTFRRAAQTSAPYREFIECCQSDSKHSR